ncbi:unnamed protein product [Blepharisma stoltei]|uniref:4-hydroxybenzoate polyprenyltransferase, mitochondrial n=1 Tax=Blepharisma stoltei TaxID=1481888 RepID=A0AAU9JIA3_9CILI|nr:unnamed protein product [Blepharisma stoltei]
MQRILSLLPPKAVPYFKLGRFHKPIGAYLVLWPTTWSAALASASGIPHIGWLGCAVGASFMLRAAGCTINDYWDTKYDKHVRRTKERPLANGEISNFGAMSFFLFNLAPVPVILSLTGPVCQSLILFSIPLMSLYPLAKRFTNWPQAVLGFAMNYGCVVNYVFLTERLDLAIVLPLYLGSWCWTMIYDTIYAYQDRVDDQPIGVKSTALLWGNTNKPYFAFFTAAAGLCWFSAGYMANLGLPYYICISGALGHLTYQWTTVDINNEKDCWNKFASNQYTGFLILLGIIFGKLTSKKENNKIDDNQK